MNPKTKVEVTVKMMESYGGMRGMRPVNEDNLSTGSGSQPDSETNLRPASPGSESLPLRFANGGGRFVTVKRQKAVITTLAFTALVIVSTVFGTLYFNTENGNELVKKSSKNIVICIFNYIYSTFHKKFILI